MKYILTALIVSVCGCASQEMPPEGSRGPASVRSTYNYGAVSVDTCPTRLLPPLSAGGSSFSLIDVTLNAPCAQNK